MTTKTITVFTKICYLDTYLVSQLANRYIITFKISSKLNITC